MILKLIRLIIRLYWRAEYNVFKKKYEIDKSFIFNGVGIEMYGDGVIIIGENSYCGNRCAFQTILGHKIVVGNNTSISHNVRIYTSNRDANYIIGKQKETPLRNGDVIIGNDCWIGANVFICEGITIGDQVVIGANSVVTKNIPSESISGGVPAKIIRSNGEKLNDS